MQGKILAVLLVWAPCLAMADTDITAARIISAMQAAEGGPDTLLTAFAEVYDAVYVLERTVGQDPVTTRPDAAASFSVVLDLWQAEQPVATVMCAAYGAVDLARLWDGARNDGSRFGDAMRLPLAKGAGRRVLCSYQFWGDGAGVGAFEAGAMAWGKAEVAPMGDDPAPQTGQRFTAVDVARMESGRPWAAMLWPIAQGEEAQTLLSIMFDVRAAAR